MVNVLEGKIKDMWRDRRMDNAIAKLKDHYILCGDGQTGETIIEQFQKRNQKFVVIEKEETKYKSLTEKNILAIYGDATDEKILNQAQIQRDKGLISALSRDTDNIVTVLTARYMNKDMNIISRAVDKNAPEKLKKAGANNTISSSEIGGRRMAALMLRPSVISFLDVITHTGDIDLDLEDVTVHNGSFIVGKSLREAKIPDKTGLTVLAVKKCNTNKITFNPNPNETFEEHDVLMVLGTDIQINKLRKLAAKNSDK
jgi:voltage-gated potassium channel